MLDDERERTVMADSADLLINGQLIAGRYEIKRLVGEGGMGSVYLAYDRHMSDRQVAVKALHPRYVGRRARERRFTNEALFSAISDRLPHHPNIVTALDSGRIDGTRPFMVMEYIEGPAISGLSMVEGRPLLAEEVCHLARGVARALLVLHEAGLVHRDLTPMNVLVATIAGEWVPKVIDLSHAASISGPKLKLGHPERLTQPHEIPGTPGYMSPGQVTSEYPSPAMDVFSFGVMLWEVLADRLAYRERDRTRYFDMQRKVPQPPPPLVEFRSDLPKALVELVEECTQVDPKLRPDARRILAKLDVVEQEVNLPGIGVANDGPRLGGTSDKAKRARLRPMIGMILLFAVILAVAMGWLLQWEAERSQTHDTPKVRGVEGPAPKTSAVAKDGSADEVRDEPEDMPKVAPVPEPATPPRSDSPVEPKALVLPPKSERKRKRKARRQPPCTDVAQQARLAVRAHRWNEVIQLTKSARCWDDRSLRLELRVRALRDSGRYAECVRVAAKSSDPEIGRLSKRCSDRLRDEGAP